MSSKRKRTLPSWMKQPEDCKVATVGNRADYSSTSEASSRLNSSKSISPAKKTDTISDGESNDEWKTQQNSCSNLRNVEDLSESDTDHEGTGTSLHLPEKISLSTEDVTKADVTSKNATNLDVNLKRLTDMHVSDQEDLPDDASNNSYDKPAEESKISTEKGTPISTTRKSCFYGSSCYRKNPQHRLDFAHPGDSEYRDPASLGSTSTAQDTGSASDDRPLCEYGAACYRKNPQHRRDFRHDAPKKRKARPAEIQDIPSDDDGDFNQSIGSDDFDPDASESDDSFVTSDSMESGNSDFNPEEDEEEQKKIKNKKKQKMVQKKKKAKKD